MATPLQIEGGITFGGGISAGPDVTVGPAPGGTGAITYAEMPPPVQSGTALQDPNAIVNGSVGFTITAGNVTGVAVNNLTAENLTFFSTYTPSLPAVKTVTWGAGSTYASSTVTIVTNGSGDPQLVFQIDPALTYPATFNYPFTFN